MASITYFDSCKTMPLDNYKNYLETQDISFFSNGKKANAKCRSAMMAFFNDFLIVTENTDIIAKFQKLHQIEKLKGKYNVINLIIGSIQNHSGNKKQLDELVEELRKWGYPIKKTQELFTQINTILNRVQAIKTKIQLLESEFSTEEKKEAKSIEEQLDNIEDVLEKKYKMNIKDYTVFEFIMLQKKASEIIERRNTKNSKV